MPTFKARRPAPHERASPKHKKLHAAKSCGQDRRLQGSISKLNQQSAAVAPAQAAVTAHRRGRRSSPPLKWARGEGPRPEPTSPHVDASPTNLPPLALRQNSATRASATLVAQMTAEAAKPKDIAKWADAAVIEVICETAEPLVADLEAEAVALVVKILGLQNALNTARAISERRRPRALTIEEHALRDMGRNVARQIAEPERRRAHAARGCRGRWRAVGTVAAGCVGERRRGDRRQRCMISTTTSWQR